jgi:hypothetical protein
VDVLDDAVSEYNFDRHLNTPCYEVSVDTAAKYGYFEHHTYGDERGGGLWFEVHESSTEGDAGRKLELTDFDGMTYLPKQVKEALIEMGFIVDEIFD